MSIRLKLTIMFLAIALIPLFLVSALTFTNYKNSLEANRLSQLQDILTFKADKIESYFNVLKTDITLAQEFYSIKQNLPVLNRFASEPNNPAFLVSKKMLDEQLQPKQKTLNLLDIMLINPESNAVYSSDSEHYLKDFSKHLPDPEQKAFKEGKDKIYLSDIFLHKGLDNKPAMIVTAPAVDFNGVFIGVIAFEVDMAPMYKITQDVTGLGKTGETLVGKLTGNQVVYLTPLRHDQQAALERQVTMGGRLGGPIQEAVQGRTGAGQLIDYRGKEVIAAWRYIPSLGWGMVAKIDTQEAFAEVTNLRNLMFIILGIIVILSGIMAFSIARSISRPINELSKGVQIVGSGNLDYKVGTNSRDEIGQLARSFDQMTQDLKVITASHSKLDETIKLERQRFYDVLEILPAYVVLLTPDYHVFFANRFFEERFGKSYGKCCYDYLFHRTEPCENCETYKVMKTQAPHHWEWTGPDNRNYDIYDFPFTDADGSPLIMEMGIDITAQKKAMMELQKSEKRLSEAQYMAHIGNWELDLVTNKLTWSDEIYRIFEIDRNKFDASYEAFLDAIHPEDRVSVNEAYTNSVKNRTPYDIDHRLLMKDGRIKYIHERCETFYDKDGKPIRSVGTVQDITEQKKSENIIKSTSAYTRSLIEASLDPLVTISSEGKVTDVNEATVKVTGIPRERIIGTDFTTYFTEPEKARAGYKQVFEKGFVVDYPLTIRHKSGKKTDVLYNATVYKDEKGKVLGVFAAARDITEKKKAEDNLSEAQKRLADAERLATLGQLSAGIVHEINNPLYGITNYLEVMKNELINDEQKKYLSLISQGVDMIKSTTGDLLNVARLDKLDLGSVNIKELIKDTLAFLKHRFEEEDVAIKTTFPAELPLIQADKNKIKQVFLNLLINSLESMSNNGKIEIRTALGDDNIKISVADNGCGIPEDKLPHIFEPFISGKKAKRERGIGLGLFMASSIISAHRGDIKVESAVGQGTTFTISLPR